VGSREPLTIFHALAAAHEAGYAIVRLRLLGQVGAITLREDGSGSTERVPRLDFTRLSHEPDGPDGLSSIEGQLVAIAAGPEAERLWWECELGHVGAMPARYREGCAGDAYAPDYVLSRFRCENPAKLRRESRLLALALLDDPRTWHGVRRVVRLLCALPLPVSLSGHRVREVSRLLEVREARDTSADARALAEDRRWGL
jgi:hypothetical protein